MKKIASILTLAAFSIYANSSTDGQQAESRIFTDSPWSWGAVQAYNDVNWQRFHQGQVKGSTDVDSPSTNITMMAGELRSNKFL